MGLLALMGNSVNKLRDLVKKPKLVFVRSDTNSGFGNSHFRDKRVLITGGGSGIGFACGKAFAEKGAKVILSGRNEQLLKQAQSSISGEVIILPWDVTDFAVMDSKIDAAFNAFPPDGINTLINCAGTNLGADGKISNKWDEISFDDWDKVMDTNDKACYFIIQKVASLWLKQSCDNSIIRHIVNISSSSGFEPAVLPYGLSKWGVVGMTQGFGRKFASQGIVVNGVAPGPTATKMAGFNNDKENLNSNWTPNGRYAIPSEIANIVLLLASEYGNNIIGETVPCDGALSLSVQAGQ